MEFGIESKDSDLFKGNANLKFIYKSIDIDKLFSNTVENFFKRRHR